MVGPIEIPTCMHTYFLTLNTINEYSMFKVLLTVEARKKRVIHEQACRGRGVTRAAHVYVYVYAMAMKMICIADMRPSLKLLDESEHWCYCTIWIPEFKGDWS
jgi:hypothetical protein